MYDLINRASRFLSEPFLQIAYEVEGIPIIAAFVLGIIGALAPCQFTGNLSAITIYGNQSLQNGKALLHASLFIFGKIVAFSSLGLAVWLMGQDFQQAIIGYFPWIRNVIGPMLILIGLYMVGLFRMNWSITIGKLPKKLYKGKFGAFFMGVSFSLAFCPTMFVLFFISLMPMTVSSQSGFLLPPIFAIGTSLPLIIVLLLIWYFGMNGVFMKKQGRKFGAKVQRAAGMIMILLGVLDILTYWTI